METRYEYALRLISQATYGDRSRPVVVALLGAPVAPSLPTDEWWALRGCVADSVSTLLGRGDYGTLGLQPIDLAEPAMLYQAKVQQGPLRHYLTSSAPWDPTNTDGVDRPVVARVQGRWLLVDGTHRYVADLLMGRVTPAYAVGRRLPCFCATNRSLRRNPWNSAMPARPRGGPPRR